MKSASETSVSLQVQKHQRVVFDSIVDPAHMTNYFISESSGRMEGGKTLQWKFPEFEEWYPVVIDSIDFPNSVNFRWESEGNMYEVEIKLSAINDKSTLVTVTEKSVEGIEDIEWVKRNTAGWANFLACLKAYNEHGINLRKGGFDFMRSAGAIVALAFMLGQNII